jgi:hypothetical protein
MVQSQLGQIVFETLLDKTNHKKGLMEWLKVKALSSNHSIKKKKKKGKKEFGSQQSNALPSQGNP